MPTYVHIRPVPRLGDIGEEVETIELEPIPETVPVPIREPIPA